MPNANINDDQDSSRWLLDGDLRLENTTEEGRDFLGFTLNVEEGFQRLFPLGQYLSSIISPLGNVKMRVSGGFDRFEVAVDRALDRTVLAALFGLVPTANLTRKGSWRYRSGVHVASRCPRPRP
jgi:hypothetical protein